MPYASRRVSESALITLCLLLLPALLFLPGCTSVSVSYDYDAHTDFSPLRTYGWKADLPLERSNQLIAKRVKRAVERELGARGFRGPEESPDFLISIHGGKESVLDVREWGYDYAPREHYRGWTRTGFGGPRWIEVRKYEEGILVLDIIDGRTEELVWRGTAAGAMGPGMTPRESEEGIGEAVAKMLGTFPPPQK